MLLQFKRTLLPLPSLVVCTRPCCPPPSCPPLCVRYTNQCCRLSQGGIGPSSNLLSHCSHSWASLVLQCLAAGPPPCLHPLAPLPHFPTMPRRQCRMLVRHHSTRHMHF